jgi:hypothetical protein
MSEWATDKIEELQEQVATLIFCAITFEEAIDQIAAERTKIKTDLDRLAFAFEQAMVMMTKKVQLGYVSGWMAGRAVDERVPVLQSVDADAKLFMDTLASYRRWEDNQAKKKDPSA